MKRRIRRRVFPESAGREQEEVTPEEELLGGEVDELDFTRLDHIGQLDDADELPGEDGEPDDDASDDEELI